MSAAATNFLQTSDIDSSCAALPTPYPLHRAFNFLCNCGIHDLNKRGLTPETDACRGIESTVATSTLARRILDRVRGSDASPSALNLITLPFEPNRALTD